MSGFLKKIRRLTEERAMKARQAVPIKTLEANPLYARKPHDAKAAFRADGYNIIAEVKFASPSEGVIHEKGDAVKIAGGYLGAGAKMLSILTEPQYFKGKLDYLKSVRAAHPEAILLRKDFMVTPYQVIEAKAAGADAILIIVAMIEPELAKDIFDAATELGLAPLVEVHDEAEMEAALKLGADFIGVNNRNLKTLKTDLEIGRRLAQQKPKDSVFICESGLSKADDLRDMRGRGYDGFLMGTTFMREADPGKALQKLMGELCA